MPLQGAELAGLEWVQTPFSLEPRWAVDPDINSIRRTIESLLPGQKTVVSFLAQGAFNKVYDIATDNQALVLCMSLPVDPKHKTLSQVTTIDWTRRHASLPVPEFIAHSATRANPVGFEWILIEKLPVKTLASSWVEMDFSAKERLVKKIAAHYADVYGNQLRGIGNIYPDVLSSPLQNEEPPAVQRIVSMPFFWGDHIQQDVPRGPFPSSVEWISAHLLKSSIRNFFPCWGLDSESSVLLHDDLSQHNILADQDGSLTGVVDWECMSAAPLWKACAYPSFPEARPRGDAPGQATYQRGADGEPDSLYWDHLGEYELTKLCSCFLGEMRRLAPEWVLVFEYAESKRDFYLAAQNCDEFLSGDIIAWLDEAAMGLYERRSFRDRFDQP
ncbi:hypothetical protein RB598_005363 [Gaeumannomyces tritici]